MPILFLYYEESLVSSNLNSKQFRFHCVTPNLHAVIFVFLKQIFSCEAYFTFLDEDGTLHCVTKKSSADKFNYVNTSMKKIFSLPSFLQLGIFLLALDIY